MESLDEIGQTLREDAATTVYQKKDHAERLLIYNLVTVY